MNNRTTPIILDAIRAIKGVTAKEALAALSIETLTDARSDLAELQRELTAAQRKIEQAAVRWAIDNDASSLLSVNWRALQRR